MIGCKVCQHYSKKNMNQYLQTVPLLTELPSITYATTKKA